VTGSTGTLFLYGIVLGAVGLLGLSLLLAGTRRSARRGRAARHGLKQSRRETAAASQERDDLIGQRDAARAETARAQHNGAPAGDGHLSPTDGRRDWRHPFGQRAAAGDSAAVPAESPPGPAGSPAPAEDPAAATRP
jgi:hypothetical protein